MRVLSFRKAALVGGIVVLAAAGVVKLTPSAEEPKGRQESEADWKMVEQALGKAGQVMPGGVYRVAMQRTDLKVKVQGVDVKPGFALGS